MSLLAGVNYDPSSAVTNKATTGLLAMTAVDTTNLRLTFTAPANGSVLVRIRTQLNGATTSPAVLLGVLDGATVRARQAPVYGRGTAAATQNVQLETLAVVTGLTPGTSYTWDAAYAVQTVVASTNIKYGGPDNSTGSDAWGGFGYEVWTAETLLAGAHYDPGTQATASVTSLLPMTAFDTSNLRLVFTAPTSGNVIVTMQAPVHGTTAAGGGVHLFGVLDGATVRARSTPAKAWEVSTGPAATDYIANRSRALVTGLTPGTTYTWDAAYGVEVVAASGSFAWGGPDTTSGNDAAGGFSYMIWDASAVPQAIPQVI